MLMSPGCVHINDKFALSADITANPHSAYAVAYLLRGYRCHFHTIRLPVTPANTPMAFVVYIVCVHFLNMSFSRLTVLMLVYTISEHVIVRM